MVSPARVARRIEHLVANARSITIAGNARNASVYELTDNYRVGAGEFDGTLYGLIAERMRADEVTLIYGDPGEIQMLAE
jgi:hypothetical protein